MGIDAFLCWWFLMLEHLIECELETVVDKCLYVEFGMVLVLCKRCGIEVFVKKNSQKYIVVQWMCDLVVMCLEFVVVVEFGLCIVQIFGCLMLK